MSGSGSDPSAIGFRRKAALLCKSPRRWFAESRVDGWPSRPLRLDAGSYCRGLKGLVDEAYLLPAPDPAAVLHSRPKLDDVHADTGQPTSPMDDRQAPRNALAPVV